MRKNCRDCGDGRCVMCGLPGTACEYWTPRRMRLWEVIAGIVILVVLLLFLLAVVVGALGDEWAERERESGREVRTFSVTVIEAEMDGLYVQETDAGRYVIGLGYDVTRDGVPVPTTWFKLSASAALDQCRFSAITADLIQRAVR